MIDNKNEEMLKKIFRSIKQIFPIGQKDSDKRIEFVSEIMPTVLPNKTHNYTEMLSTKGDLTFPLKCKLLINGKEKEVKVLDYPVIYPGTGECIVGGNAYSPINLLVQRNGTFFNKKNDDDFEVQFNASGSRNFKFKFQPSTHKITCEIHGHSFPALPILRESGITETELKRILTEDVYKDNYSNLEIATQQNIFDKFLSALDLKKEEGETDRDAFKKIVLDDEINEITLGLKDKKLLDKEVLKKSVSNLIDMYKGKYKALPKESTVFKKVKTGPDFIASRLFHESKLIRKKIKDSLMAGENVEEKINELLNKSVNGFYISSQSSNLGVRINPLAIKEEGSKITKIGEGGITEDTLLTDDAKQSQYDSVGFIDPIHTPESSLTGVTLHLSKGTSVIDGKIVQEFINVKTGKKEKLNHFEAFFKKIAFPDDYDFEAKKFTSREIDAVYKNEKIILPASEIEYVFEPERAFGIATNLIAGLDQTQGNRAAMGAKQQTQAVPLVNRERPLFASGTEEEAGEDFLIKSENDGIVSSVDDKIVKVSEKEYKIPKTTHIGTGGIIKFYPNVKKGDKVKVGDVLITTNFHDKEAGKELSMGTNLYTAYMPFEGDNIEDAMIVSQTAAKEKLISMHSKEYELDGIGENIETNTQKYKNLFPVNLSLDNQKKLDHDGIIKEGEEVFKGDIIIAGIRKKIATEEDVELSKLTKSLGSQLKDAAVIYKGEHKGKVASVIKTDGNVKVIIEYESPLEVGDKLTGRCGNKGIVSKILPDEKMPRDKNGKVIDIILNPIGTPSRINPIQQVETALIKDKNDRYITKNFKDFSRVDKAKSNGGKETLFTDKYGEIENVNVGKEYFLKLMHVVDKKISARSNEGYTADSTPTKGGGVGGQSIDHGMIYGLAAHGANNFLLETSNYKNQNNPDLWDAIAEGRNLPKPDQSGNFAFKKFNSILNAMGVNTDRVGNSINFYPGLSKEIGKMHEIEKPDMLNSDFNPQKGGLFDYSLGGTKGEGWGKVTLKIPVKNPIFAKNIATILSKEQKEVDEIKNKDLFEELKSLNVDKEIEKTTSLKKTTNSVNKIDEYNKKLKLLYGLKKAGVGAETYMLKTVPVLPPIYRPVVADANTNKVISHSFNDLYKNLVEMNNITKEKDARMLTRTDDKRVQKIVDELYKGRVNDSGKEFKGLMKFLAGTTPKEGFFQKKVIKKRQDYSGRSTITTGSNLAPWEVGVPKKTAFKIFEPFVVNELKNKGYKSVDIDDMLERHDPIALEALKEVSKNKPVLLNRAPSLHRYSTMAFMPVIHDRKDLQLHPLFLKPYNADHDGDTMGVHVAVSKEGDEDLKKILAANLIFNEGYQNRLNASIQDEQISGLYSATKRVSEVNKNEKIKTYSSILEVKKEFESNKLVHKPDFPVIVKGENMENVTSFGRAVINSYIPNKIFRIYNKPFTKKVINDILLRMGPTLKPIELASVMDDLRVAANFFATKYPISLGVEDLINLKKEKFGIVKNTAEKNKNKSEKEKHKLMFDTITEINEKIKNKIRDTNNFMILSDIGAKGNELQTQQIIGSPGYVLGVDNKVTKDPIISSFGEGLRLSEYFSAMPGVRKGMIGRAQATAVPGALGKVVVNNTHDQSITVNDCGTKKYKEFSVDDIECLHRLLALPVAGLARDTIINNNIISELKKHGIKTIKLRSPDLCEADEGICSKCFGSDAYGNLKPIGSQVGIEAAQTLSEPLTQAAMNAFHTGGLAVRSDLEKEHESNMPQGIDAIQQAFYLSENRKSEGVMSENKGKVSKITTNSLGEKIVTVGNRDYKIPMTRELIVKVGDNIEPGNMLSDGAKNMHTMFNVMGKDMDKFRPALVNDIRESYGGAGGQSQRMFEVVAKSMTNIAQIKRPGDNIGMLEGDIITLDKAKNINKNLERQVQTSDLIIGSKLSRPIDVLKLKSGKVLNKEDINNLRYRGISNVFIKADKIEFEPIIKGILTAPHKKFDDPLARMNFNRIPQSIQDAASFGMQTRFDTNSIIPRVASGIGF